MALPNYTTLTPSERNQWVLERASESVEAEAPAIQAWFAIASAPPEGRYNLFLDAAKASGLVQCNCAAMVSVAQEVGAY